MTVNTHTFLALDTQLIPNSTKTNLPTYSYGLFSNDGSRMLIDGYKLNEDGSYMLVDEKRVLCHPQATLSAWLQWSANAAEIQSQLLSTAIEFTVDELSQERNDPSSIWYVEPVEIL